MGACPPKLHHRLAGSDACAQHLDARANALCLMVRKIGLAFRRTIRFFCVADDVALV